MKILTLYILWCDTKGFVSVLWFLWLELSEFMFDEIFEGVVSLKAFVGPSKTVGCLFELAADWYWWMYLNMVVGEIGA